VGQCRCDSTIYKRSSHKDCPLKKNLETVPTTEHKDSFIIDVSGSALEDKFIQTVKTGCCIKSVSSPMTVLNSPAATVSVLAYQSVHVGEVAERTSEDVPRALGSVTHLIICLLKFIPTVQNSSLIKELAPLSPDKKPKHERC